MQEQGTLTETVIKNYEPARATVPIRINSSHPYDGFRVSLSFPAWLLEVIDGNLDGPHRMYLLIAYIVVPNGTAHLSTWGEG